MQPVRHALGALLLAEKQYAAAEETVACTTISIYAANRARLDPA
jgi:hypothetical protein